MNVMSNISDNQRLGSIIDVVNNHILDNSIKRAANTRYNNIFLFEER